MVSIVVDEPLHLRVAPGTDPTGAPASGHVILRVLRAGICGSDLHILHGSNPFARYPRVIGHEFAGVIEEVGAGVEALRAGQRVVVDPVVACGHCYPCRIGRSNVCGNLEVFGVHRDGGFRDRLAVPAANCIPVPDGVSTEVATLAEPLSIAANVLARTGIDAIDTVLIYGAGTVGLTVLQVAKLHGARCLVADIDAARLERARGFGADVVIDSSRDDVPARVAAENDGLGPTLVIDGAGSIVCGFCAVTRMAGGGASVARAGAAASASGKGAQRSARDRAFMGCPFRLERRRPRAEARRAEVRRATGVRWGAGAGRRARGRSRRAWRARRGGSASWASRRHPARSASRRSSRRNWRCSARASTGSSCRGSWTGWRRGGSRRVP